MKYLLIYCIILYNIIMSYTKNINNCYIQYCQQCLPLSQSQYNHITHITNNWKYLNICLKCIKGYQLIKINQNLYKCQAKISSIIQTNQVNINQQQYQQKSIKQSSFIIQKQQIRLLQQNCTVQYCSSCPQSPQICTQCIKTFTLISNICSCPQNYVIYNQTCIKCDITNCINCSSTNICIQCKQNFTLIPSGSQCECQVPYTLQNYSTICTCLPQQIYNPQSNQCLTCVINQCILCVENNICQTCVSGLQVNSVVRGYYCAPCPIDCVSCAATGICSQCQLTTMRIANTWNKCVYCNNTNCLYCSSDYVCAHCQYGFQLSYNSSTQTCVNCSAIPGCLQCYSNNQCASCTQFFTYNPQTSTCTPCPQCNQCQPSSSLLCTQCIYPYSSTPYPNGTCYYCYVTNCQTCTSQSLLCTQCLPGYVLQNNSTLCIYPCDVNCYQCSSTGQCIQCIDGYALSQDMLSCGECSGAPFCLTCNYTNLQTCLQCNTGYYLNQLNQCVSCGDNCRYCELQNNSVICKAYKYLTRQFVFFSSTPIIVTQPLYCNPICLQCSAYNPNICTQCNPGFYLTQIIGNTCKQCPRNCKTCNIQVYPQICTSCYPNSFLSNGVCQGCNTTNNCLTCLQTNTSKCLTCRLGYALNSAGSCINLCGSYCKSCLSQKYCLYCIEGYARNINGTCMPCMYNCSYCAGDGYGVCMLCGIGYYMSNINNSCIPCTQHCLQCNKYMCLACAPGYFISNQYTCIIVCKPPCATCSPTNSTLCTSCTASYIYNSTSSSCIAYSNCTYTTCNICPYGYTIPYTNCLPCQNLSNCLYCLPGSLTTCQQCQSNYYLQIISGTYNTLCIQCNIQCSTCLSSYQCLSCSQGYIANQLSLNNNGVVCQLCEFPCFSCRVSRIICDKCVDGYVKMGWKCVSKLNFRVQVKFGCNLNVFYSNYQAILMAILGSINVNDVGVITINTIYQINNINNNNIQNYQSPLNLVVLITNISTNATSFSSLATKQYNNLTNYLKIGNKIVNIPIVYSQVSTLNGQIRPNQKNQAVIGVILGITIPFVILIIVGVLCWRYKKKLEKMKMERIVKEQRRKEAQKLLSGMEIISQRMKESSENKSQRDQLRQNLVQQNTIKTQLLSSQKDRDRKVTQLVQIKKQSKQESNQQPKQ